MHLGTLRAPLPATPDTPYDAANYPQSKFPAYPQTPAQLETDLSDKPPWVQQWTSENVFGTNPEGQRLRQLRALKSVDDAVDEVFTKLEADGRGRRHARLLHVRQRLPLGGTRAPQEEQAVHRLGSQIPLFMRWPANPKVRRNDTDDRLVANIDIAPTVMDAAGVTADPGKPMDGVSLLDRTQPRPHPVRVLGRPDRPGGQPSAFWKVPPWASIITRDYQYTENYDAEGTQPTFREYYDLRHDPYELTTSTAATATRATTRPRIRRPPRCRRSSPRTGLAPERNARRARAPRRPSTPCRRRWCSPRPG